MLLEKSLCLFHLLARLDVVLPLARITVIDKEHQRLVFGDLRRNLIDRCAVACHLVEISHIQRDFGQQPAHINGIGILFNQTQVLPVGLADIAAFQYEIRVQPTRLAMEHVVVKNVPQLDQGALNIALFQKLKCRLIVGLGALFAALACGQRCDHEEQNNETSQFNPVIIERRESAEHLSSIKSLTVHGETVLHLLKLSLFCRQTLKPSTWLCVIWTQYVKLPPINSQHGEFYDR